jgi:hypothetical protein
MGIIDAKDILENFRENKGGTSDGAAKVESPTARAILRKMTQSRQNRSAREPQRVQRTTRPG